VMISWRNPIPAQLATRRMPGACERATSNRRLAIAVSTAPADRSSPLAIAVGHDLAQVAAVQAHETVHHDLRRSRCLARTGTGGTRCLVRAQSGAIVREVGTVAIGPGPPRRTWAKGLLQYYCRWLQRQRECSHPGESGLGDGNMQTVAADC
jgi:hypothetical protein